jgi:hypothetical protein
LPGRLLVVGVFVVSAGVGNGVVSGLERAGEEVEFEVSVVLLGGCD